MTRDTHAPCPHCKAVPAAPCNPWCPENGPRLSPLATPDEQAAFAWLHRLNQPGLYADRLSPLMAYIERLQKIAAGSDVSKILLDVVPGDEGMGVEIYAKSAEEVVAKMTEMGQRIEDLETRPPPPYHAIGTVLSWSMDEAIRNGANSVSMPDELVTVAAWLSGILPEGALSGTKPMPCQAERCKADVTHCDGACQGVNPDGTPMPVLYVSPAQFEQHDPQRTGRSNYLPAVRRAEGNFTKPLYAEQPRTRPVGEGDDDIWRVHEANAAPVAPAEPAEGWVLVPKRMTQEMRDVTDSEGWTWADLLAEAGSISQEEYAAIAAAPVAPVDHDEFALFRNDLCDFLRHVIDMAKGDHYWDVVRGNAGALLRRVARIAPVAPARHVGESKFEDWLSCHRISDVRGSKLALYHKQDLRDAYAAGMSDPTAAPVAPAVPGLTIARAGYLLKGDASSSRERETIGRYRAYIDDLPAHMHKDFEPVYRVKAAP